MTATKTISILRTIFSRMAPNQIVTDNSPQFTAIAFEQFCNNNSVHHTLTAPYHSSSNGEAECFVQTFKNTMQKKGEVELNLSKFLLRYRTTPHSVTGKSPAELIFGRQIKTRLDLLHPDESNRQDQSKRINKNLQRIFRSMRRCGFTTITVPPNGSLELLHRKLQLIITW